MSADLTKTKTNASKQSVTSFVNGIEPETRRADAKALLKIFKTITGKKAVMWSSSIIGFDTYHYKYDSGREGDSTMTGFSPRKSNLAIYIMDGFSDKTSLLKKLGKHKTGSSCLYIKKLADVDEDVLCKIITKSYLTMQKKYA